MKIFNKKMTLIVDVFSKLRTPKHVVKWMSKNSRFRGPFDKQHCKGTKLCRNMNHTTFTIFIDHCEDNWVGKNCLILFLNTLTADNRHSLPNRDNSRQSIQMQLLQKQKIFSQFVAAFLKATLNLEHFQKKMTLIAHVFWKL